MATLLRVLTAYAITPAVLAGCIGESDSTEQKARSGSQTLTESAVGSRMSDSEMDAVRQRIATLRQQIERQTRIADAVVAAYVPRLPGRLDDLGMSCEPILRQIPGVATVHSLLNAEMPAHRIVHLANWHYVPREAFAADVRTASDVPLSNAEIDDRYEELLLQVELVQAEQRVILRCLIQHHGLRWIFYEGLTDENLSAYQATIEQLREFDPKVDEIRARLERLSARMDVLKDADEDDSIAYRETVEIYQSLVALLDGHRADMLQVGAAGQLLMTGELEEVLPLEDAATIEAANPVRPDGTVQLKASTIRARQDAMVQRMLAGESFAFMILGGAHDLSESLETHSSDRAEYIKIGTRAHGWVSE